VFVSILILLCWESILIYVRTWRQDNCSLRLRSVPTFASFPPHPSPPKVAVCLAIPVNGAVNYILPVSQRALLLPDVKRTARMCCSLEQIKLNSIQL